MKKFLLSSETHIINYPLNIMNKKLLNAVFTMGAILVLISSVLVMEHVLWGKYCFAVGVALFVICRSRMTYTGNDFRMKRLNRLYFASSLLMVVAAYLQFQNSNSWIVLLLIVAITEFYASMRFSLYEKENARAKESEKSSSETSIRK